MIYGDSTHQNHHFSFYVSILLGILTKKSYFFNQKNIAFIVLNVNTQKKVLKTPCIISKYIVQYTSNLDCDGSIAKLVRQKTATLRSSVQVRLEPPKRALVAKLVDAQDLKSCGLQTPCRFDSGPGHHLQICASSSTGQSTCLRNKGLRVQFLSSAPII